MPNNPASTTRTMSCRTLPSFVFLSLCLLHLTGCLPDIPASRLYGDQLHKPRNTAHINQLLSSDGTQYHQTLWTEEQPLPQLSAIKYSSEPISKYGNPKQYAIEGKKYFPSHHPKGYRQVGMASWYGKKFHGRPTSSGEKYDMHKFTAAHRTLLLPSIVRVTNLKNNRSIVVKVNDRGPFYDDRIVDLSYQAAKSLGMVKDGVVLVELEVLAPPVSNRSHHLSKSATLKNRSAYLQAGSFMHLPNARTSAARLNKLHLNAKILPHISGAQSLYRVLLGPFHSQSSIVRAEKMLHKGGFSNMLRIYISDPVETLFERRL